MNDNIILTMTIKCKRKINYGD